eukprot:m.352624 g.352624  ORF g.352624 m.352624 type:complete len:227 (-) comp19903_c9_seq5:2137-2817(-)
MPWPCGVVLSRLAACALGRVDCGGATQAKRACLGNTANARGVRKTHWRPGGTLARHTSVAKDHAAVTAEAFGAAMSVCVAQARELIAGSRVTSTHTRRPLRVLLAISGGPDSLALAALAAHCSTHRTNASSGPAHVAGQRQRSWDVVGAITIDHGLRHNSAEEAAQVGQRLRSLGLQHHVVRLDWDGPVNGSLQAVCRARRYRALFEAAMGTSLAPNQQHQRQHQH